MALGAAAAFGGGAAVAIGVGNATKALKDDVEVVGRYITPGLSNLSGIGPESYKHPPPGVDPEYWAEAVLGRVHRTWFAAGPQWGDTTWIQRVSLKTEVLPTLGWPRWNDVWRSHVNNNVALALDKNLRQDDFERNVVELALVLNGLEGWAKDLGWFPRVNSWYRGTNANSAVGGSIRSRHMSGRAADIEFIGNGKEISMEQLLKHGLMGLLRGLMAPRRVNFRTCNYTKYSGNAQVKTEAEVIFYTPEQFVHIAVPAA